MGIVSLGQVIVSHSWGRRLQLRRVNETEQERLAVAAFAVVEQLILTAVAVAGAVGQDVFEFDQAGKMPT